MRIRSIPPGFWTDDVIASVDEVTALLLVGLWGYCDDEARGRDDARLVKAALYALREDVSATEVERRLRELHRVGLIERYRVGSLRYLTCLDWWQKPQHPTKSKLPALADPTAEVFTPIPCELDDLLRKPRESLRKAHEESPDLFGGPEESHEAAPDGSSDPEESHEASTGLLHAVAVADAGADAGADAEHPAPADAARRKRHSPVGKSLTLVNQRPNPNAPFIDAHRAAAGEPAIIQLGVVLKALRKAYPDLGEAALLAGFQRWLLAGRARFGPADFQKTAMEYLHGTAVDSPAAKRERASDLAAAEFLAGGEP